MAARYESMPTSPLSVVIRHLLADLGPDGAGLTDRELLARFVSSRDDHALAALVRRHAPMVWGVCDRLLYNHHDAEDAFQATFLVLVRKAKDVPSQAVANWLYGVARQTAVRLRATAAKRGRRETQVGTMPEPTVAEVRDADWQSVLDEELSRLPEHYRGVLVLCDLEGRTRKEAARQLGIPEGSVASRLARARAWLAKRLTQRGVVFSGGSVAAVLSAGPASASAPPALVASTIKAASLRAAGRAAGVISAKVAALTEGVVQAMFVTKIKSVLAGVLVVGLALGGIGTGVGLSTNPAAVAQQPGAKPDDGRKGDDKVDWRVRVLDEQIARLREEQKRADKERAAAIERTIGELLAQRERFSLRLRVLDEQIARLREEQKRADKKRAVAIGWIIEELLAARERYSKKPATPKDQKQGGEKQPMTKEEKLRVLIDKVLAAHGGEDKLNKLTSFTMTVKHSNGETQHYFVQPPKNFRWETTHRDRTGKRIVILFPQGRRWWSKEPNEEAKEFILSGIEPPVEYWLDYVKFFGPRQVLRLKDADHKVALLDEGAKVGDRAAMGVQVTGPRCNWKMYFDKETHLLVKLGAVTYSDYKKFDGIPIAQKEHDGHFEPEVTDFRAVDKFDAKLFEQP